MQTPTQELLETSPVEYFEIIKGMNQFDKINEKPYCSWHSNHVQALSYLAGKLKTNCDGGFYGYNIKNLDQDVAIEILDNLMRLGADIHMENYYNENIMESLENKTLFVRTDNERFIERVKKYYY